MQYEKALERLQEQTTELNRSRKNSQVRGPPIAYSSFSQATHSVKSALTLTHLHSIDPCWESIDVPGNAMDGTHIHRTSIGARERGVRGRDR